MLSIGFMIMKSTTNTKPGKFQKKVARGLKFWLEMMENAGLVHHSLDKF